MDQKPKKQSIKISEFEWYQVQNKVRQYMHDLLQPFQRKQIDESAKIAQLKRQMSSIKQKLSEHAFLLKQSDDKPKIFTEMEGKIDKIQKSFMDIVAQQHKKEEDLKMKLEYYDEKMKLVMVVADTTESQRRKRIEDKEEVVARIEKEVARLTYNIEAQTNDFNVLNATFRTGINNIEQKNLINENRIKNFDSIAKSINKEIDLVREDLLKQDQKSNKLNYYLTDLQKRMDKLEDNNELSKKFISVVDDLRNEFVFIQNYIDKYMPLFVQSQISDTLNCFVNGRSRKALCIYEQRIFNYYNEVILKNEELGLENNIRNYVQTIQRIILRNRKFTIKLKVDKRVKLGTKEYDIHTLDGAEEDDGEKKVTVQMVIPEDKMKGIIQSHWGQLVNGFKQQLKDQSDTTKIWLKEIQEFVDHKGNITDQKIQTLEEKIVKQQTQNQLQVGVLKAELDGVIGKVDQLKVISVQARQLVKQLTHFASIINHIIIQDEIDRQGIALYGLRETQKDKQAKDKPNINLDNKCFSCSGFPASTLSAFKMACLAYNPSNVFVEGKAYKREQILQFGTKLLQNVKQKLSNQPSYPAVTSRPASLDPIKLSSRAGDSKTIDTPRSRLLPNVSSSRGNSRQLGGGRRELLLRRRDKSQVTVPPSPNSFYY